MAGVLGAAAYYVAIMAGVLAIVTIHCRLIFGGQIIST